MIVPPIGSQIFGFLRGWVGGRIFWVSLQVPMIL